MKILAGILLLFSILSYTGCSGSGRKNSVNIQQINPDNSNNWYYIFREEIEKEKKEQESRRNSLFL